MKTTNPRHRALATHAGTAAALLGATLLAFTGCDTNARFNVNQITYKTDGTGTRILGVWPARDNGGTLVRACSPGPIDGFMFNLAFASTQRTDGDPDNSIHPGDVISKVTVDGGRPNDIKLTGTNNVTFQFDCLDPAPDPNGGTTCDGVDPSEAPEPMKYCQAGQTSCSATPSPTTSLRGEPRNILVVVDLSGSTSGFVDVGDNLEYPNDGSGSAPAQLQTLASDFGGFRFAQLKTFIEGLREDDRFGILAFREDLEGGGIAAPCVKLGADGQDTLDGLSFSDKLTQCYGTDRSGWLAGIDALSSEKNWGRANLWEAVDEAYDFIAGSAPNAAADHIVVISDGPDTCGYDSSATDCKFSCSETSADDVVQKIQTGLAANPPENIKVHFIQFDSVGYPGADPRQMEVACESGGHFQFINRTALPNQNLAQFQAALGQAMENIRFSLSGHFQVPIQMSALASGQTQNGTVYSVKGALTVETSSQMVASSDVIFFAGGENGVLDKRPKLRKGCGGASDCGGPEGNECIVSCTDAGLCVGGTVGIPRKNGTPCSTNVCCTDSAGTTSCLAAGQACDTCP